MSFDNYLWRLGTGSSLGLILIGAKYGHAGRLDADSASLLNKAQVYHLMTSTRACSVDFALMALATRKGQSEPRIKYIAAGGLIGGLFLFCLPLYIMAVNGRSEGTKLMAPIGGVSLLTGWLAMIFC